jgi:hypothetical protein
MSLAFFCFGFAYISSKKRTIGERPQNRRVETRIQSVDGLHEDGQRMRQIAEGKRLSGFDLGWRGAAKCLGGVSG